MQNIVVRVFNSLPEKIAGPLRCIYRNRFKNKRFKQYYRNGRYEFLFENGISLLSYYPCIQDEYCLEINGYLANSSPKKGDIVIDAGGTCRFIYDVCK